MKILETKRLVLREIADADAAFILELLNTPKFIEYIGDRGVRTVEAAAAFIEDRYRQSYREHGFGLYLVEVKAWVSDESDTLLTGRVSAFNAGTSIGVCGFVKRDSLPDPDLGFAFLPQFEGKGYAFESAEAAMQYGRDVLGLKRVLAITTPDNNRSVSLLEKLGFKFERLLNEPHEDKTLKLYLSDT